MTTESICICIIVVILIIFWFINYCVSTYKERCDRYFYTIDKYPKMKRIQDNWITIRDEIPKFDINTVTIARQQDEWLNDKADKLYDKLKDNNNWIKSWNDNNTWFNYPLMYNNKIIGKAEETCPNTIKLLKSLNNIQVAGYSLLVPYGEINYHTDSTGPTYNSMAFNMKLTGKRCRLIIRDKNKEYIHIHIVGKAVIFNSEHEHMADNNSDIDRVILYIDFINNI
jgi:aspartyl/asparaginyl beta-hydroxylase (cupin superfamily)